MKNIIDIFPVAVKNSLEFEGGFADDPFDSGGKTIYGISTNNWPEAFMEVFALYESNQKEKAIERAKLFYRENFFNDLYNYIDDSSLAFKLFDFGINAGRKKSVKLLQRTLNSLGKKKLKVDGLFGNLTLTEINSYNVDLIYLKYIKRLEQYYKSLRTFWRFGRGWLHRLKQRKFLKKRVDRIIKL